MGKKSVREREHLLSDNKRTRDIVADASRNDGSSLPDRESPALSRRQKRPQDFCMPRPTEAAKPHPAQQPFRILVETPDGVRSLESFLGSLFELASRLGTEIRVPAPPQAPVTWSSQPGLLDTNRAAAKLGMSKQTLANWRLRGNGPPFFKIGNAVRYRPEDMEAWIDARRARHTAEAQRRGSR